MIRSNPASPRAPLGFLQRQGRFRDGVHASLHGALVMQLAGPSGPRPSSPLSPGDVARIAGIHRPGNLELARRYGCFAADDLRWFDGA